MSSRELDRRDGGMMARQIEESAACENKADDGEPCGNVGEYYPDYQMYLCVDCSDGYGLFASD